MSVCVFVHSRVPHSNAEKERERKGETEREREEGRDRKEWRHQERDSLSGGGKKVRETERERHERRDRKKKTGRDGDWKRDPLVGWQQKKRDQKGETQM